MKSLFKAIYEWLDRKFPDVVVITLKEYQELDARILKLEAAVTAEKIRAIEAEINKFNVSLGFGGTIDHNRNKQSPFQR